MKDLKYKVGTKIEKFFPATEDSDEGWYSGIIKGIDVKTGWYYIVYDDGDKEDLSPKDMKAGVRVFTNNNRRSTRNRASDSPLVVSSDDVDAESADEVAAPPKTATTTRTRGTAAATKKPAFQKKHEIGTIIEKYFPPSKDFDGGWFQGKITGINVKSGWYYIIYDDGDEEDLSHEDLAKEGIRILPAPLKSRKTKATPSKNMATPKAKVGRPKRTPPAKKAKAAPKKKKPPAKPKQPLIQNYEIGTTITKYFGNEEDGEWYSGTIKRFNSQNGWYHVVYKDGDQEDLTEEDIDDQHVCVVDETLCVDVHAPSDDQNDDTGNKVPSEKQDDDDDATVFDSDDEKKPAAGIKRSQEKTPKKAPKAKKAKVELTISSKAFNCLWLINDLEAPDMDTVPLTEAQRMSHFFLFAKEVHTMWERRKLRQPIIVDEPNPSQTKYSKDPFINHFAFFDVFRELDRRTTFFHNHVVHTLWEQKIRESWDASEWMLQVLFASYLYRQIHRKESFEKIGGIPTTESFPGAEEFVTTAKQRFADQGEPFFTSSHQTCSYNSLQEFLKIATESNFDMLKLVVLKLKATESLKDVTTTLEMLPGIGPFFGWQILCDLRESHCLGHLTTTVDYDTYCQLGPGAKKGLSYIFPDESPNLTLIQRLVDMQGEVLKKPLWGTKQFKAKELEHALCEYSKYYRLLAEEDESAEQKGKHRTSLKAYEEDKHLYANKPCAQCLQPTSPKIYCDLCRDQYCQPCLDTLQAKAADGETKSLACWICQKCSDFNKATV